MKKFIIIGFSGKSFAGKSTYSGKLLDLIKQELPGTKADIIPLPRRLKDQARILGWDGKKDERGRRLLQELSCPIKYYHGEDCYAKRCVEEAMREDLDILIVDDVRMMPEYHQTIRLRPVLTVAIS